MTLPRVARTFLSGLAVVLPIVITIAVLVWLVGTAEALLATVVGWVLPEGTVLPQGLGLLAALGLIFAVGVLMEAVYFRRRWAGSRKSSTASRWSRPCTARCAT
jgi:uncharacterized membrane protein